MSNLVKLFVACCFFSLILTSCGDDAIKGCTDPEAENYNPDADESDSSCTYARDKFIGDYLGTLDCELGVVQEDSTYSFKILESTRDGAPKNEVEVTVNVTVDVPPIGPQTVPVVFPATINGNNLSVDNYMTVIAGFVQASITADMNMQSDNKTIVGPMSIDAGTLGSDNCTLTGVKQ